MWQSPGDGAHREDNQRQKDDHESVQGLRPAIRADDLGCAVPASFSINNDVSLSRFTNRGATFGRPGAEAQVPCVRDETQGFRPAGRLGCSRCYEVFEDRLEPLLRRIHGSDTHVGKAPAGTGERARIRRQLETLKRQLSKVVAEEAYEEAAELRDKIKEFEAKLRGNPA